MSVAFRRESDEEHLEPKFEVPIAPGANLVTPRGLRLTGERVAAAEAAVAAAPDDATREAAKRDLRYWQTRLATAVPAPVPPDGEIGIGSRALIRLGGRERTITIVGGDEADPAADRIAFSAPLARALIGGMAGELIDFGGKADAIALLAVDRPEEP